MTPKILCPTRGGQASYPNQDYAIAFAKENNAELIFLYVSNIEFLDHTAAPKVVDIETELDEMGEFLLAMAVERAKAAGMQATGIVRRDDFSQSVLDIIQKFSIGCVVIGKSRVDTGVLTTDFIEKVCEDLSQQTGAEFLIVHKGKVEKRITTEK